MSMWKSMDREKFRREGLVLFSKLIRTKNVEKLQEHDRSPRPDDRKQKLTVSRIFPETLPRVAENIVRHSCREIRQGLTEVNGEY